MLRDFLLPGIVIGIGAGLSPGPLLMIVLSGTLKHGVRSGLIMTLAPLFTDIPFAIVSILLAHEIGSIKPAIGILSILGAAFLVLLAYQNITIRKKDLYQGTKNSASFTKAVVTNIFNPYLYIFWFSVAIPIFARGNLAGSIVFAVALNIACVISMMLLVLLVGLIRMRFVSYLHWGIRILGVLLLAVAITFAHQGILLLK